MHLDDRSPSDMPLSDPTSSSSSSGRFADQVEKLRAAPESVHPVTTISEKAVLRWTSDPAAKILREVFDGFDKSRLEVSIQPLAVSSTYLVDSGRPGPLRRISGGIHGNELCGPEAVLKLLEGYASGGRTLESGGVVLMLGNEGALLENKRYLDENLNRMMGKVSGVEGSEVGRAQALMSVLRGDLPELHKFAGQRQFALDLHSTSLPTPMFVWAERFHVAALEQLGVPNAVIHQLSTLPEDYQRTVQCYCTRNEVLCFTVECGQNTEEQTFLNATQTVDRFLQFSNAEPKTLAPQPLERLGLYVEDHRMTPGFQFTEHFKSFQFLRKGTEIARDNERVYIMKADGYLLFPHYDPPSLRIGKEETHMVAQKLK
ncbi:MAG: succinylglutamate desuccinylase/aspartoacylase family protein [Bdellovibrionales bacterium]|nr:succinylglutamate desuccinylase/aspartoacylase family protein [Bdellovibrionales bacterium]